MLSRMGLIVSLFALAASAPAHAAVKRHAATKPTPATSKPAPSKPAPSESPLAAMVCRQTVKGGEAQPKASGKPAGSATARAVPRAATKSDLTVCGYTQTHALHTFPDACQAQAAGATVLHPAACNGAFCPQGCAPDHGVVARRTANGQIKSYDNVCWAEKDHAVILRFGKCPSQTAGH
ncbi:MAG: hypothetical protein JO288_10560 [Hyphomicrobiales bacterium]|nr:hypothetical protein [Hyphomicrobiales bacterium]